MMSTLKKLMTSGPRLADLREMLPSEADGIDAVYMAFLRLGDIWLSRKNWTWDEGKSGEV